MFITYALWALYHTEYAVLAHNSLVIRCLKERVPNKEKRSRVNIYTPKILFYLKQGYFKDPPLHFKGQYILNKGCISQAEDIERYLLQQNRRYRYVEKDIENNKIKHYHVNYEILNRLASLEAGPYCTVDRCWLLPINH